MKILLIEDDAKVSSMIKPILQTKFDAKVSEVLSVQAGIELLDGSAYQADIIICDYHGTSSVLLKALLQSCKKMPCIFILDQPRLYDELKTVVGARLPKSVNRQFLSRELLERITELSQMTALDQQALEIVEKRTAAVEKLLKTPEPDPVKAREEAESSLEVIQDMVLKFGFAPEVQNLVSSAVSLSMRVIGTKPKLAAITEHLKRNEGKYLASHSIMLAEICCAIAYKTGWNSAATFLKLSLAAFLHDMPIRRNDLAKCTTLVEARKITNISADELKIYQHHPATASEYAKRLNEIPPDVDIILVQHHEQPDGSGFPRGLHYKQISPLSCLFIIAEDMLHFYLNHDNTPTMAQFIAVSHMKYQVGAFRKILKAMET